MEPYSFKGLGGPRFWMPLAALVLIGCATVLDIESAELDEAQAGAGGSAGDSETGTPTSCQLTGDPCMDCVASKCCTVYESCEADAECQSAMSVYNYCLAHPPTTGESCPELFAQFGLRALAVSGCVFRADACANVCNERQLDTTCSQYCNCMAEQCPDTTLPGGECVQVCPTLTSAQINCRTAHCIAGASIDPALHCPHVAGESVCP